MEGAISVGDPFFAAVDPSKKQKRIQFTLQGPLAGPGVLCLLPFGDLLLFGGFCFFLFCVFVMNQTASGSSIAGAMSVGDLFSSLPLWTPTERKNEFISAELFIEKGKGVLRITTGTKSRGVLKTTTGTKSMGVLRLTTGTKSMGVLRTTTGPRANLLQRAFPASHAQWERTWWGPPQAGRSKCLGLTTGTKSMGVLRTTTGTKSMGVLRIATGTKSMGIENNHWAECHQLGPVCQHLNKRCRLL